MTIKKMHFAPLILIATVFIALGGAQVHAQAQRWIQVESQNNIRDTRTRAQFFANNFPDTKAFQTTSAWYAIVIGPLGEDQAATLLGQLKNSGQIPADSFVTDGASHISQLWPLAANATATPAATDQNTVDIIDEDEPAAVEEEVVEAIVEAVVEDVAVAPATNVATDPATDTATDVATDDAITDDTEIELAQIETPDPVAEPEPIVLIEDPDLNATRRLERTWSRDQRMEYQTYMVWTGDYEAGIDGAYGPGTRAAIRAFQEREGYQPTGYMTEGQVALLQQRYTEILEGLGVEIVRDLDAGIQIQVPGRLVQFERFEPPFVHYGPKDDSGVRVMLISQVGGTDDLRGLYSIMETLDFIPPEGYRTLKRDWFVLSGRNDEVVSYTYAKTENGILKGFSLIWPPEQDDVVQPFATIMYESFTPLEDYVLDENVGYDSGEDGPLDLTSGLETETPAREATGFVVNAEGVVVTHASNVLGCRKVTVGDGIEMQLHARGGPDNALAILLPVTPYQPKSYALFTNEVPEIGTEVTVSGFSFPEVMEMATLNYGTLTDTNGMLGNDAHIRVSAYLEAGDVGGPVLDDRGAVLGMQLLRGAAAQNLPQYVNFALKADLIVDALTKEGLAVGRTTAIDAEAPEDIAFMAGDFTLKVSCWR